MGQCMSVMQPYYFVIVQQVALSMLTLVLRLDLALACAL